MAAYSAFALPCAGRSRRHGLPGVSGRRQMSPGLAEARRGAEPGLAPRASGRKERLGVGLTRTLCPAAPR